MTGPVYSASPDQPDPQPVPRQVTARDLWDAVDEFTNPTRQRLVRDGGATEHVSIPSLYDQLVDAMESGAGQKLGGTEGSKPPLDAGALSLLITIAGTIRSGCRNWGLKPTFDDPKDLRQVVSAVARRGNPTEVALTFRQVKHWCGQVRAVISSDPDRTWRMYGVACRVCSSVAVPVYGDDGSVSRQPALAVHSEDGRISSITCGFCGSVLSGPDLVAIVNEAHRALKANEREDDTA